MEIMINGSLAQRLFGGNSLLSDFPSDNLWGSMSTGNCSLLAHAFPVLLTIQGKTWAKPLANVVSQLLQPPGLSSCYRPAHGLSAGLIPSDKKALRRSDGLVKIQNSVSVSCH